MTFQPLRAIVTAPDSGTGRATAVTLAASGMHTSDCRTV
jgi:hypothetical protein